MYQVKMELGEIYILIKYFHDPNLYFIIKPALQIQKSNHDNYLIIILLNTLNEGKANSESNIA